LELIILVILAAVVLYNLYAVLGRRVGRQPEDAVHAGVPVQVGDADTRKTDMTALPAPAGLAAVRSRDPNFDVGRFLQGSRIAYEAIVRAFAVGDRPALAKLTTPAVMANFETSGRPKAARR
jgi:predicted lipid-binding transport protein (Tim44 family)